MRPVRLLSLLPAAFFIAVACTTKRDDGETRVSGGDVDVGDVRQAIQTSQAQFIEATKRGDAAAVATHYEENARLLPPNMPMATGRENIRQTFDGMMKAGTITDFALNTQDVTVIGDGASEVGTFELTMKMPDGKAMTDRGKYLVFWRRQADGKWLMVHDMWNSDTIPSQPPASK